MDRIFDEIRAERERQDAQWGGSEHDIYVRSSDWLAVVDKFARNADRAYPLNPEEYRRRMMQIAAIAVAACEAYDRIHDGCGGLSTQAGFGPSDRSRG